MQGSGILGVDFCSDRLNVVQVRQGPSGPVLDRWVTVAVPPSAHPADVAGILRKTLQREGFSAAAAVFGLPEDRGFAQCFSSVQGAQPKPLSMADYVTDSWELSDGRQVRGVAGRADVNRLIDIAAQSLLELIAIELRPMACLTALGLMKDARAKQPVLGLVIDSMQITLAVVHREAPVLLESRIRPQGADARKGLKTAAQMVRLAQMSGMPAEPAEARIIAGEVDDDSLQEFQDSLGLPVNVVPAGGGAKLEISGEGFDHSADYAAAIGLALEGLQQGSRPKSVPRRTAHPRPLNFLQAPVKPRRRFTLTWSKGVAAVAVLILIAVVRLAFTANATRHELETLEAGLRQVKGQVSDEPDPMDLWRAVRSWVAQVEKGQRVAQRPILDEITKHFPPTNQAYVTLLEIRRSAQTVTVTLTGRSRDRQLPYDFVDKLNASDMFDKAKVKGEVATETDTKKSLFDTRFSVVFDLRQPEDA